MSVSVQLHVAYIEGWQLFAGAILLADNSLTLSAPVQDTHCTQANYGVHALWANERLRFLGGYGRTNTQFYRIHISVIIHYAETYLGILFILSWFA